MFEWRTKTQFICVVLFSKYMPNAKRNDLEAMQRIKLSGNKRA